MLGSAVPSLAAPGLGDRGGGPDSGGRWTEAVATGGGDGRVVQSDRLSRMAPLVVTMESRLRSRCSKSLLSESSCACAT